MTEKTMIIHTALVIQHTKEKPFLYVYTNHIKPTGSPGAEKVRCAMKQIGPVQDLINEQTDRLTLMAQTKVYHNFETSINKFAQSMCAHLVQEHGQYVYAFTETTGQEVSPAIILEKLKENRSTLY